MDPQLTLGDLEGGFYCGGCSVRAACPCANGPRACQDLYGESEYGGVNVVHPARHDFDAHFSEIDGPEFQTVKAIPVELPRLPRFTPRLYPRREFDGVLHGGFYAVGADEAIIGRRQVLGADDMREIVGLWSDQRLALMLFGKDQHLERIWPRRHRIVDEIAECDYDLVAPPSYSALVNHPPSEGLRNLKRSLHFFELLQEAGVPTAPRLAWLSQADARRAAQWCVENPAVELVTLDLAIKDRGEWQRQILLLRYFDEVTARRLKFFIHGPQAEGRLVELFGFLGDRLHLTGSRAISKPRDSPEDYVRFVEEEEAVACRALLKASSAADRTRKVPGAVIPIDRGAPLTERLAHRLEVAA
jgi:hypothetical protein